MEHKSVLPADWEIPETFRLRIGDQAGRQRAMFADDHMLLVLHAPPSPEDVTRKGRFFWRAPDGSWRATIRGAGTNALRNHVEEYFDAVARCEDTENSAQNSGEYFEMLAELGPILHAAKNLYLVLQDARKLVPEDRDLINLRDRAGDLQRTGELLYDVGKNGLDFAVAKRAEEQTKASNRMAIASHRLNLLVAFFFPIATLTAVFGVSFKSGLEDRWAPYPFWILIAVGLLSGIILMSFVIRNTGE